MARIQCLICGSIFYVKPYSLNRGWGKYCSTECRQKAQLTGKFVNCSICIKRIYRAPAKLKHSKSKKYFCSKSCQTLWRNSYFSGERHPNWISGIRVYRQIMKKTDPIAECINCGFDDKRALCVHHLDHNRENNVKTNLVWICQNCHYLVHHYKEFEEHVKKKLI